MSVRVVLLGRLRDLAESAELSLPDPLSWDGLLAELPHALAREVRGDRVHVACGGAILADKTSLAARDGDEVALLPPVSGG